MSNNNDMSSLLGMLAKMDKKQIEEGLAKANQILNSNDKDKILDEIKKIQNK